MTWAELRARCPSDLLGTAPLATAPSRVPVPMASFREVLDYAKASGATLNVEIKNIPTEPDFDPTPAYAETVLNEIRDSGLPLRQLIVQSFWPPNLDQAELRLPGVQTAFLTLAGTGSAGAAFAKARGYEWWSPGWPVTAGEVGQAHALGLKVVPWTLNRPDEVKAAAAAGVDALITDDPVMARVALGLPAPASRSGAAPPRRPARVRVRGLAARVRVRRGTFTVRVRTTGAVRRRLVAVRAGRALATGRLSASRAGAWPVRLRLTAAGRRALARRRAITVAVAGARVRVVR
jgi:hypothetical protein